MKVKTISLWQPWASLVALGEKRIETRSWSTSHRGQIAIHAAKTWSNELHGMCCRHPFDSVLGYASVCGVPSYVRHGRVNPLPFGAVLAVATLADCVPVERVRDGLSLNERAFGDYTTGRFAWLFEDVRPLSRPFPLKGHQGLFMAEIPPVACP